MIAALAEAGAAVGETGSIDVAAEVTVFVESNLGAASGRWHPSRRSDGWPRHLAGSAPTTSVGSRPVVRTA